MRGDDRDCGVKQVASALLSLIIPSCLAAEGCENVACRGMRPAPEIRIDLSSDFAEFSESDVNHLDCIKSVPLALQG